MSFWFLLWACRSDGDKITDEEVVVVDADGDGFLSNEDCDDNDATVYPNATETCDGVDNNCDGDIDEELTTRFYSDTDGDGFGDPNSPVEACDISDGLVENSDDCDDSLATVSPDQTEECDGLDNDCNGEIDDGVGDPYYEDLDQDGFGDDATLVLSCELPADLISVAGDCDDLDPEVHPDAIEVCDEIDNNCDEQIDEGVQNTYYDDADGDGFGDPSVPILGCQPTDRIVDNDLDCDDINTSISPAVLEICDGQDNNCDGQVDEDTAVDAITWYLDADGDGYGSTSSTEACDPPASGDYVQNDTDCDDADSNIHPMALEICDDQDNDCDGLEDDLDPSVVNQPFWYADGDGDGFGDVLTLVQSCDGPGGYTSDNTDCNDGDGAVHPNAQEECDGIDNNCDTLIDDNTAVNQPTWYIDGDTDGFGDASVSTTSCNSPLGYVDNDTDCDDGDGTVNPGMSEVWYDGVDSDCSGGSDFDQDSDGWLLNDPTDPDCDDEDGSVNPGTSEVWYDGVDSDCSGGSDFDQDGDGYESYIDIGGPDCDDLDGSFYLCGSDPSAPMEDCLTILNADSTAPDGIYWIDPQMDGAPFEAYCDMTSYDGGWMLLLKDAPYYEHSGWSDPNGWNTVHDANHISPGYSQMNDFTDIMVTSSGTVGDVSQCWSGMSLYEVITNSVSCTPTQIGSYPQTGTLTINANRSHNGCSGLRARIGFSFSIWDGGISGAWNGIGVYGYKTNNTVFGTSCVFTTRPWPAAHNSAGDLYVR